MGESACQAPAGQLAFSPCPADINGREVGGGRATRQPGQVRKEAALTSAVRVARQPPTLFRSPATAPLFGANAAGLAGCMAHAALPAYAAAPARGGLQPFMLAAPSGSAK